MGGEWYLQAVQERGLEMAQSIDAQFINALPLISTTGNGGRLVARANLNRDENGHTSLDAWF
jgi:hypothetical protein